MKTFFRSFVFFCVASVLFINLSAQTKSQNTTCSELYYVSIIGLLDVDVSDSKGGKFLKYQNFAINSAKGLLGYLPTGESSVFLTFDPSATHYVDFKFPNTPIAIEVVKGCGNSNPNMAVRFRDVSLPVNSKVRLTLSPQSVSDLVYDKDGDGELESVLKSTVRISGVKASDTKKPRLVVTTENRGVYVLVTITAEESVDIKKILYSLDGIHFKVYKEPFQIQYTPDLVTIYTFADNNIGVRSGLYTKNFRFMPEKRKALTNLPF
jgi:hypothetical protein